MTDTHFQYRIQGAAKWTTIPASSRADVCTADSCTSGIDITNEWDISNLDAFPDGIYELRAITVCGNPADASKALQSQTEVVVGKIDRAAPKLLYAESLAIRPVFTADDQVTSSTFGMFKGNPFPITVTLNEPVLCMGLNPATAEPIVSHFVLTIFGTEFGGSPLLSQANLARNDDLHFKCIDSTIQLTLTETGLQKFVLESKTNGIDKENGGSTTSSTLVMFGVVDHAGNVMPSAPSPIAVGGIASIAKQLTEVTDTNVNLVGKQLMDQMTLMWEWMEDSKQETRKQLKYNRDLIEQKEKPQEERKLLLALPMTYAECMEMNVDDHAATGKDVAFQIVDITLEDGSNAWSEAAKAYGDPFTVDDIKEVVIDCYDPLTHPCARTASCDPDKLYQEAVATVIFHGSLTKSAYDNVFSEVVAATNAPNGGRLPVVVSTFGGVLTTGKMVWATSRYRFENKALGCCSPGVTPMSETSLEYDEVSLCEQECLADVECTAFNLYRNSNGVINENTRFRCEHHKGIVTGTSKQTLDCRQTDCSWKKVDF